MNQHAAAEAREASRGTLTGKRAGAAMLAIVLLATPLVLVKYPPITDLPQQVAQLRLAADALTNPDSPYKLNVITPHSLAQLLFGIGWLVGGAEQAGRIGMLLLLVLWVASVTWIAARRGRPAATILLASLLFMNQSTYWGFASYLLGGIIFIYWLEVVVAMSSRPFRKTDCLIIAAGILALYFSHALWCAAGCLWWAGFGLYARVPLRTMIIRGLGIIPAATLGLIWYPQVHASGFNSSTDWLLPVWARLLSDWMAEASFGGLINPIQSLLFFGLFAWLGVGLWQNRHDLSGSADKTLLLAGGSLLVAALLMPDVHQQTLFFASRWVPFALAIILLGAPVPRAPQWTAPAVAVAMLVTLSAATSWYWYRYEKDDLAGLEESLALLPDSPSVLGLDFVRDSEYVDHVPGIQVFAYSQVTKGGDLNFSFASFPSSPVVFRKWRPEDKEDALLWHPTLVFRNKRYLNQFDFAMIRADNKLHERLRALDNIRCMSDEGYWRLYEVTGEKPLERVPLKTRFRQDQLTRNRNAPSRQESATDQLAHR